jgi:hypothetical protein
MTLTKLGNFFNDISVKLKNNVDLHYFEENGYCDYRCGCDFCKIGDAYGFKTNILDLITDSDNKFHLDNLDLQIKDSWCENEDSIYLQSYYETTDVTVINEVYKYYSKYIKLIELCGNCNKYDILYESCSNNGNYSSTKITSTFEKKDILEIKNIHLCSNCYMWFICQNQQYLNNFNLVNPIKFFWIDVVKNYLYDIIEFDDENKKYLFS